MYPQRPLQASLGGTKTQEGGAGWGYQEMPGMRVTRRRET